MEYERLSEGTRKLGNKGTSRYYPDYSIVEIGQTPLKNPRYLERFAVNETPLKKNISASSGFKKISKEQIGYAETEMKLSIT